LGLVALGIAEGTVPALPFSSWWTGGSLIFGGVVALATILISLYEARRSPRGGVEKAGCYLAVLIVRVADPAHDRVLLQAVGERRLVGRRGVRDVVAHRVGARGREVATVRG